MKILYFAPLPFNDIKQRPQQIAEELSKIHEIWYVEPTVSYISSCKLKRPVYKSCCMDICQNFHILRLDGRFSLPIRLQFADPFKLNTLYERKQLKELLQQCDILWVGYEVCKRLIPKNHGKCLIYDKMDDNSMLSKQKTVIRYLRQMDKEIIDAADFVFVTASRFYTILAAQRDHVYLIPNGIGFEKAFKSKPIIPKSKKKIFGYIGKISHWFDFEAIRTLANANPDCEIALVGPNDQPELMLSNVKYYGIVPKGEVPIWIEYFDVCLYPFKDSQLLDTIDPVKIYEYLAMNKPVIAVDSLEVRKYGSLIHRYGNHHELIQISHTNLERPFANHCDQIAFLMENSWESRVKVINEILQAKEKNLL